VPHHSKNAAQGWSVPRWPVYSEADRHSAARGPRDGESVGHSDRPPPARAILSIPTLLEGPRRKDLCGAFTQVDGFSAEKTPEFRGSLAWARGNRVHSGRTPEQDARTSGLKNTWPRRNRIRKMGACPLLPGGSGLLEALYAAVERPPAERISKIMLKKARGCRAGGHRYPVVCGFLRNCTRLSMRSRA